MRNTDFNNINMSENSLNSPEIPANVKNFWRKVIDMFVFTMLQKNFYAIRVKNLYHFNIRDLNKGNIIISNHNAWWDGLIAYYISRKMFKTNIHMMIEGLYRFPLLSKAGGFSVEKNSPFSALKSLNYASEILKNPQNSIWIYPQGEVLPPDYRPISLKTGVAYLCKKTEAVNVFPVAVKYTFLREDRPEILIEIGRPIVVENQNIDRKEFNKYLEKEFEGLLNRQFDEISQGNLSAYEIIYKSKLHPFKRIENRFTSIIRNLFYKG